MFVLYKHVVMFKYEIESNLNTPIMKPGNHNHKIFCLQLYQETIITIVLNTNLNFKRSMIVIQAVSNLTNA